MTLCILKNITSFIEFKLVSFREGYLKLISHNVRTTGWRSEAAELVTSITSKIHASTLLFSTCPICFIIIIIERMMIIIVVCFYRILLLGILLLLLLETI